MEKRLHQGPKRFSAVIRSTRSEKAGTVRLHFPLALPGSQPPLLPGQGRCSGAFSCVRAPKPDLIGPSSCPLRSYTSAQTAPAGLFRTPRWSKSC